MIYSFVSSFNWRMFFHRWSTLRPISIGISASQTTCQSCWLTSQMSPLRPQPWIHSPFWHNVRMPKRPDLVLRGIGLHLQALSMTIQSWLFSLLTGVFFLTTASNTSFHPSQPWRNLIFLVFQCLASTKRILSDSWRTNTEPLPSWSTWEFAAPRKLQGGPYVLSSETQTWKSSANSTTLSFQKVIWRSSKVLPRIEEWRSFLSIVTKILALTSRARMEVTHLSQARNEHEMKSKELLNQQ